MTITKILGQPIRHNGKPRHKKAAGKKSPIIKDVMTHALENVRVETVTPYFLAAFWDCSGRTCSKVTMFLKATEM